MLTKFGRCLVDYTWTIIDVSHWEVTDNYCIANQLWLKSCQTKTGKLFCFDIHVWVKNSRKKAKEFKSYTKKATLSKNITQDTWTAFWGILYLQEKKKFFISYYLNRIRGTGKCFKGSLHGPKDVCKN